MKELHSCYTKSAYIAHLWSSIGIPMLKDSFSHRLSSE